MKTFYICEKVDLHYALLRAELEVAEDQRGNANIEINLDQQGEAATSRRASAPQLG
jgi:hypothetical protein